MTNKSPKSARSPRKTERPQSAVTVVVTPHETMKSRPSAGAQLTKTAVKHAQLASQVVDGAKKATAAKTRAAITASGKAMSTTVQSAAAVTAGAAKTAKAAGKVVGDTAKGAAKAGAGAVADAAQTTAKAASKTARAASAAANVVGDLNGDGRVDAEDLKIAKRAVGKAAAELGSEAWELSKAALRHDLTKEAAARALVGGAVAAVVPVVGVPVGAAVGAATVLLNGSISSATSTAISKGVKAVAEPKQVGRPKAKQRAPGKPKG